MQVVFQISARSYSFFFFSRWFVCAFVSFYFAPLKNKPPHRIMSYVFNDLFLFCLCLWHLRLRICLCEMKAEQVEKLKFPNFNAIFVLIEFCVLLEKIERKNQSIKVSTLIWFSAQAQKT